MIPPSPPERPYGNRKPRASGDDPGAHALLRQGRAVNPARAGMIPHYLRALASERGKPRASGDDPLATAYYELIAA